MPEPSVDPTPLPLKELRCPAPLDAHEASYFAASAKIPNFLRMLFGSRVTAAAACWLVLIDCGA